MDTSFTATQLLAFWGAFLSTILAGLKVWEVWKSRFNVSVEALFTSFEDTGHEIKIRNISPFPLILSRWEIFHRHRPFLQNVDEPIDASEWDRQDTTIAQSSTYVIKIVKDHYFPITHKTFSNKKLCIRLHFVGYKGKVFTL